MSETYEIATLGGGCFWCTEAAFEQLRGVVAVEPGYAGGDQPHPTYEQVCTGTTGHAEVARVTFDPAVLPYRDLLDIFFTIHDPTTLNRQGADVGTQYRSVIFYHDEDQRRAADEAIRSIDESGVWGAPAVTEVSPLPDYYPAEDYHREYYRRNSGQPYCQAVITPKLAKLRRDHFDRLKRADEAAPAGVRPYLTEPRSAVDQGGIAD